MPRMSGTLAARELRRRGFKGPIYGMTGDPVGCAERDAFEAAGLTRCMDKNSAGLTELYEVVAALLGAPAQ